MPALCQHTLLEYSQCERERLRSSKTIRQILCQAVLAAGGTIVKATFHNFSPYGVSGVVVITESHVTIHTWPEYAYAAVDIFSCNPKLDHRLIERHLKRALAARQSSRRTFKRGPRRRLRV
jgi:S-adenosylmethionine decarboxylase